MRRDDAAAVRHADDLVEHPSEGWRDELPRRALPGRQGRRQEHDPVHRRHPDHRPALHAQQQRAPHDRPRPHPDAAHHPDSGRHRGGRDAVLRRHRLEHLVPGRPARREPDARQRPVRAAAGGREVPPPEPGADASAARASRPFRLWAFRARRRPTSSSRPRRRRRPALRRRRSRRSRLPCPPLRDRRPSPPSPRPSTRGRTRRSSISIRPPPRSAWAPSRASSSARRRPRP